MYKSYLIRSRNISTKFQFQPFKIAGLYKDVFPAYENVNTGSDVSHSSFINTHMCCSYSLPTY